jgi:hypothetical protein
MLFQSAEVDRPQRVTTRAHKVRYDGERVVVNGWRLVWGNPVVDKTDYGLHFRIVGGVAAELPVQYKDLLARCDVKALPEELPEVKDHPIFRGITLSTAAPEQDVIGFEQRLEEALQACLWQLADEIIAAVLKTRDSTPLQALLKAIQAADTLRLAEHFTDAVAALVRQVLRDARLVTVDVRLADYDGPAQLGDDPKEIDDVIAAFRSFLTRNIAAARQANPGKTVRLNLKAG